MREPLYKKISTQIQFEAWQSEIPNKISFVEEMIFSSSNVDMNYSSQSLEHITAWLLQKYDSLESAWNDEGVHLLDSIGCYIGETFRKHLGGRWTVELQEEDYVFWGYPGITGFTSSKYEKETIYPFIWSTVTLDRQSPFIMERFNIHINR